MKLIKTLIFDFGLDHYHRIWKLQKELVVKKIKASYPEIILIGEHHPVYTLGKKGNIQNIRVPLHFLKSMGCKIYRIERGGDITWHGPGQMVCYPIFNIKRLNLTLHDLVFLLEETAIKTLNEFDIKGVRINGMRGVWTEQGKIASIGLAIKQGISFHGLALNVRPDLSFFDLILPCGLKDVKVCSIASITGTETDMKKVKDIFIKKMAGTFNLNVLEPVSVEELITTPSFENSLFNH